MLMFSHSEKLNNPTLDMTLFSERILPVLNTIDK